MPASERHRLDQEEERERSEIHLPVVQLQFRNRLEEQALALELAHLEAQLREQEVIRDFAEERAKTELRLRVLPVEQAPVIADALSKVFHDSHLNIYGNDSQVLSVFLPLLRHVAETMQASGVGIAAG